MIFHVPYLFNSPPQASLIPEKVVFDRLKMRSRAPETPSYRAKFVDIFQSITFVVPAVPKVGLPPGNLSYILAPSVPKSRVACDDP